MWGQIWCKAPESNGHSSLYSETLHSEKTSLIIPKSYLIESASDMESSFFDSYLFQHSFLRWPALLQYHNFNVLFLPFDLDLEVPLDISPLSLDRPITTKSLGQDVSKIYFFLNSSDNNAPTIVSNSKVSVVLRLMEETT